MTGPVAVTLVEGKITTSDGVVTEFLIGADGGWQQWGAAPSHLSHTVDAMEAMTSALLEDGGLEQEGEEDGE